MEPTQYSDHSDRSMLMHNYLSRVVLTSVFQSELIKQNKTQAYHHFK